MGAETLDAEVKARIPKSQKDRLEVIAAGRQLKVSDIIREAIREKFEMLRRYKIAIGTQGQRAMRETKSEVGSGKAEIGVKALIDFSIPGVSLVSLESASGYVSLREQPGEGIYRTAARLAKLCDQNVVPIHFRDPEHPGFTLVKGELFIGGLCT